MSLQLAGRVALITGGGAGIGACMARRLRDAGADAVVADVDAAGGRSLAAEIDAHFIQCDVRSLADNREAVRATVERYGALDIALLNAGVGEHGPLDDSFDDALYRRTVDVNLNGVVYGMVAAIPAMRERGGDIVATASLAGLTPFPLDPVYTATKHAVVGLVRALAPSLLHDGIRVNALCPGFADTAIIDPIREVLSGGGMPLLSVGDIADALLAVLQSQQTGECWYVQPGREAAPYRFGGMPGPRVEEVQAGR